MQGIAPSLVLGNDLVEHLFRFAAELGRHLGVPAVRLAPNQHGKLTVFDAFRRNQGAPLRQFKKGTPDFGLRDYVDSFGQERQYALLYERKN